MNFLFEKKKWEFVYKKTALIRRKSTYHNL